MAPGDHERRQRRGSSEFEHELAVAGGAAAPASATTRLRALLAHELERGATELVKGRSGYDRPLIVAFATADGSIRAASPAAAAFRVDPSVECERGWLLAAAIAGALVELAGTPPLLRANDLALRAGDIDERFLVLSMPVADRDADAALELAPLALEEHAGEIDRLRVRALGVPASVLPTAALKPPVGSGHPLRVAEALARLGMRPADQDSAGEHEEELLAVLGEGSGVVRPHDDPDPALRIARRILQRLDGMGKWGGYHTEFVHLPRGFAGNERALAQQVGEALVSAGLLLEKPSVGQRHVFLNPGRAGDIRRLVETGETPADLVLPS